MQRKWRRIWARRASAAIPRTLVQVIIVGSLLATVTIGYANPTNGNVYTGGATINDAGKVVTVNQTTQNVGIKWDSFSIQKDETVNFVQPGTTAIALNRIIGTDSSAIYGALSANGKVFLINPNGIVFSKDAQVNVGSLVASTNSNVSDRDIFSGSYNLAGGTKDIDNEGSIIAVDGNVELWGNVVNNNGIIQAKSLDTSNGVIRLVGNTVNLGQGSQTTASGDLILHAGIDGTGSGTVAIADDATAAGKNAVIYYNPVSYNDAVTKSDTKGNPYKTKIATTGTLTSYMLINTGTDLANVDTNLAGTYALSQDINLSGSSFVPLGTFTGVVNGENYTINNLKIVSDANEVGLFSSTNNAKISNLTLSNVDVEAGADTAYVGSLIGKAKATTIDNVNISSGTVKLLGTGDVTAGYAGGIVGRSSKNSTISNSTNLSDVTATGSIRHAGGIVGMNDNGSVVSASTNYGAISALGDVDNTQDLSAVYVGGIAAYNYTGSSVIDSVNYGTVTAGQHHYAYLGGIVGANWNGSLVGSSLNYGTITSLGNSFSNVGGIVGGNGYLLATENVSGSTVDNSINYGSVIGDGGWIGGLVGLNNKGSVLTNSTNNGSVQGDGTVADIGGLVGHNIASTVTGNTNNGKISSITDSNNVVSSVYDANGVVSGVYDANVRMDSGQEVSNASKVINRNVGGLIGSSSDSIIQNNTNKGSVISTIAFSNVGGAIGLSSGDLVSQVSNNANISGSTNSNVGGVVGFAYNGTALQQLSNTGAVTTSGSALVGQNVPYNSSSNVGGLVGWLYGAPNITTTLADSNNSGTVYGNGWHLGGLVGQSTNSAAITDSTNSGAVTASNTYSYAGGIIGANTASTITDVANTGNVQNTADYSYAAGIAGASWSKAAINGATNSGNITDTGKSSNSAGIAGANGYGSTVNNVSNSGNILGGSGSSSRTGGIVAWEYSFDSLATPGIDFLSTVTNFTNTGSVLASGGSVGNIIGKNQLVSK